MSTTARKADFHLPEHTYLLNHSVGRPLCSSLTAFTDSFIAPWRDSGQEPWQAWLKIIGQFQSALGQLFNAPADQFCPQVNLSGAVAKLLPAIAQLQKPACVVLMSEIDFPSMGFAVSKALPHCELRFIPADADVTELATWSNALTEDVDLVFISHAYSNTGQQAPVQDIVALAQSHQVMSIVDVAQSAGIIPLDLALIQPDFLVGSSVKWLCGGPGAAYLWINPNRLADCTPRDVGWFSHENPFEFDIHQFRQHPTSLRFWGGTPSIAPYAFAAHSIAYFNEIGVAALRQHNQQLLDLASQQLQSARVSPAVSDHRSGTLILDFGSRQSEVLAALQQANISVDARNLGMRVSPHIYNDSADMQRLVDVVTRALS